MSKSKSAFIGGICGILISVALTCAGFLIDNHRVSSALLWQYMLIAYLLGPGPLLSYDAEGGPRYEGTPVHILILPSGLLLGVVIYSFISYFILRAASKRRAN